MHLYKITQYCSYYKYYTTKKANILQIDNLYKLKILQKAHKFYYSNTNKSLTVHSYSTRFSISNLPVPFFSTTAGQSSACYQESALWNRLKPELKNQCNYNAFRAGVRFCHLAGEL